MIPGTRLPLNIANLDRQLAVIPQSKWVKALSRIKASYGFNSATFDVNFGMYLDVILFFSCTSENDIAVMGLQEKLTNTCNVRTGYSEAMFTAFLMTQC